MRLNYETCIVGDNCVLVPYRPEHVPKYHKWMLDPYLLEMTGSEPLSLPEEVAMQQAWREDDEKCTFIVLAKDQCDFGDFDPDKDCGDGKTYDDPEFCLRNLHAMVGDVNLFFSDEEEDEEEEDGGDKPAENTNTNASTTEHPEMEENRPLHAELDIMISVESCRGKGLGKEASSLMMLYGAKAKKIRRFFCKIKEENEASLSLFQKRLGFQQCAYAACFQEYELERKYDTPEEMVQKISTTLLGESFQWTTFSCTQKEGL